MPHVDVETAEATLGKGEGYTQGEEVFHESAWHLGLWVRPVGQLGAQP